MGAYRYDAWGNILYQTNAALLNKNPLRYRGYIYDNETGFYYLQSRYYDPKIGRFLNADSYASTGQGFIGYNMYAYCNNSPVKHSDVGGNMCVSEGDGTRTVAERVVYQIQHDIQRDLKNFDIHNTDAQKVVQSNYFSAYNGVPYFKVYDPDFTGVSFGVVFIGDAYQSADIVKHEYGHCRQLQQLGIVGYTTFVAIPSLVHYAYYYGKDTMPSYDYYSMPMEYDANALGDVEYEYDPWAHNLHHSYRALLNTYVLYRYFAN